MGGRPRHHAWRAAPLPLLSGTSKLGVAWKGPPRRGGGRGSVTVVAWDVAAAGTTAAVGVLRDQAETRMPTVAPAGAYATDGMRNFPGRASKLIVWSTERGRAEATASSQRDWAAGRLRARNGGGRPCPGSEREAAAASWRERGRLGWRPLSCLGRRGAAAVVPSRRWMCDGPRAGLHGN